MDNERLRKALELSQDINRLEDYLKSNKFETIEIKLLSRDGEDSLKLYESGSHCFSFSNDDSECITKIKQMVIDCITKELSRMKKEFEEL